MFDANKLVLFGGMSTTTSLNSDPTSGPPFAQGGPGWTHAGSPSSDLYILDTRTLHWTRVPEVPLTPPPRAFHGSCVFGPDGHEQLVVMGGVSDRSYGKAYFDCYLFNLISNEWTQLRVVGEAPSPRFGGCLVHTQVSGEFYFFGGWSPGVPPSDQRLFRFKLGDGVVHSEVVDVGGSTPPLPRAFHSMDMIQNRLVVFAGKTTLEGGSTDLYTFDVTQNRWSK